MLTIEDLRSDRGTSGYYGVIHDKRCSLHPWAAHVWHPARKITVMLGYYRTPEQAAERILRALHVWKRQPYTRRQYDYCRWGHPLIDSNLFVYRRPNGRVDRVCKRCTRQRERQYKLRRKAQGPATLDQPLDSTRGTVVRSG